MSVGGHIIEIRPHTLIEDGKVILRPRCVRIWVMDRQSQDESIVYAEVRDDGEMPKLGEEIWWSSGNIFFDNDRKTLKKIAYSHAPYRE